MTKTKLKNNIKNNDMKEFWLTLAGTEPPHPISKPVNFAAKPINLDSSMQAMVPKPAPVPVRVAVRPPPKKAAPKMSPPQPQNNVKAKFEVEMKRKDSEGIFTPQPN